MEYFSYSEGQRGCLCRTVEEGSPHSPQSYFINISPPFLVPPSPATQAIQTLGRGGGTEKCHSCLFPPAVPEEGIWEDNS